MGWKTVKEHYGIKHIVQTTHKGLCIGSPYLHDMVVIDRDGTIIRVWEHVTHDAIPWLDTIKSDPETFRSLMAAEDQFSASIPVFTYSGSLIIDDFCEEPGWPNVTHTGRCMYENSHSTNRDTVVEWAKRNARAGIELRQDIIKRLEGELEEVKGYLSDHETDLANLLAVYPDAEPVQMQELEGGAE